MKKEFSWWRDGVIYQVYLLGLSSTERKSGKVGGSSRDLRADEALILIKD